MNFQSLKESINDITYVKGRYPVFQMPYYFIKSDKSHVSIGD